MGWCNILLVHNARNKFHQCTTLPTPHCQSMTILCERCLLPHTSKEYLPTSGGAIHFCICGRPLCKKQKKMQSAGFEPAHTSILRPERSAVEVSFRVSCVSEEKLNRSSCQYSFQLTLRPLGQDCKLPESKWKRDIHTNYTESLGKKDLLFIAGRIWCLSHLNRCLRKTSAIAKKYHQPIKTEQKIREGDSVTNELPNQPSG